MLLSIKLNQLLITLVLTSIFAEITGIKLKELWKKGKSMNKERKKKKINARKIEMGGICETLNDYYKQYTQYTDFIKTTEGKGLKTRLRAKKKQHRTQNCGDSNDYNAFTTFAKKNQLRRTAGGCDLIKPQITSVTDHKYEKEKRNKFSKILTSYLKSRVKKHEAIKEKELQEKDALKIEKKIKWYYKIFCNKVMPHYNLFYIFYTNYSEAKKSKGHTITASCDYFERIPENKING
ncbi:uncharacterized protein LOC100572076 isoform X2 [Acyrthosiphon pisum]|uniref:Uncharacterized protein n=1 Tax=Acyrthosiphon pisum TaxID=7029 RepID=A0A8R2D5V6_ACYPI|nr:uncharacterized protein LOC100572076 isoform X2 [Acyrthosiphon pisum]|eukprot:XP_016662079.1 PREDICTED: uncharacterized protein LOC100572076 [Acyrthosiphon pisum]